MISRSTQAQSGATLMVALMMLLVLTLIGLAAVRGTTQQIRTAANTQFQAQAFQTADSIIRKVVAEVRGQVAAPTYAPAGSNLLIDSISTPQLRCNPNPASAPTECPEDATTGLTGGATVSYVGQYASPGSSLGVGSGGLVAHRFRINAMGRTGSGATSIQEQGMERIGPGAS